ncbi:MAG: response regulator [Planctomycetes bacterium]|nr:response regulator [Planctomycetota bacterium]
MTGPKPNRVLVADDDPSFRELLAAWLEPDGAQVTTASDGVEACELADAGAFDMVLLDLLLPRRDGYAVLLHLRARPATRDVPVLLVSGEPPADHAAIGPALGADGFLAKPFTRAELRAAIEAAAARAGGAR